MVPVLTFDDSCISAPCHLAIEQVFLPCQLGASLRPEILSIGLDQLLQFVQTGALLDLLIHFLAHFCQVLSNLSEKELRLAYEETAHVFRIDLAQITKVVFVLTIEAIVASFQIASHQSREHVRFSHSRLVELVRLLGFLLLKEALVAEELGGGWVEGHFIKVVLLALLASLHPSLHFHCHGVALSALLGLSLHLLLLLDC
mmetsp:Transcript_25039/g.33571  ORF Transcript_25039/g.33571 Transcript_25039/m.33571 type:complete len:201 (-) Transcript_25039:153-755(-)